MPRAPVGLLKGIGDVITDVDDAFLCIVGYSREEFSRSTMNWREMTPAEFVPHDEAAIRQALAAGSGGFTRPYQKAFIRRDGSQAPVLVCCAFIPDAPPGTWMEYVVDLSQDDAARAWASDNAASLQHVEPATFHERLIGELVRERTSLLAIFDTTPSMMWAVDRECRLITANAEFHHRMRPVINRTLDVGESVLDTSIPEQFRAPWKALYERALRGEGFVAHTDDIVGGVQTFWDHALSPIRNAAGDIVGVSVVSQIMDDRVKLQRRAEQRERDLREAHRIAGMGSWEWDPATDITRWSDEMYRIYDRDPALGAPRYEELAPYHTPEVLESLGAMVARALTTGEPYELDTTFTRRDGTTAWVMGRGEAVRAPDGTIIGLRGTTNDITTRKMAELALQHSEAELRDAQRIARLGSWDWHKQTNELTCSPTLRELLAWPDDEPVPPLNEHARFYTAESWQRLSTAFANALAHGEPYTIDLELASIAGMGARKVVARGEPLRDSSGTIVGVHGIMMDVTDLRQAEEENRRLERQLIQSQKMQAVGQLAGGIAHDFNNLLTAILLQTSALGEQQDVSGDIRDALQDIEAAANRATSLTRQLLMFSRQQAPNLRPIELNGLVAGFLQMLRRLIGTDISLAVSASPDPLFAQGDQGMLEQVLLNLVVNARDAMPSGGTIRVNTRRVELDATAAERLPDARPGEFVVIEVVDSGCGIDEHNARHVFEPFFTTKAIGKGTGLGLATAHGIVSQHAGWMEFESTVGVGSTFRLMLPASVPAAQPDTAMTTVSPPPSVNAGRVLLVEDEPSLRRLLTRTLERGGYSVVSASDGPDALQRWHEHGAAFDLVVSDMMMPGGITGLELLRRFAQQNPSVRTLLITGFSTEMADRTFEQRTGGRVLGKPFTPSALLLAVSEELATAPTRRGAPLSE